MQVYLTHMHVLNKLAAAADELPLDLPRRV